MLLSAATANYCTFLLMPGARLSKRYFKISSLKVQRHQEPTEVEEKEKQRVEALKAVEAHAQEVLTGNTGIYLLGKRNFGNSVLYIGIESHGKTSMMPAVSCCVFFFRFHSFI